MVESRMDEGPTADDSRIPAGTGALATSTRTEDAVEGRIVIVQRGGASVPLIMLPALLLISAAVGILLYRQGFPHPTQSQSILVAAVPADPEALPKAEPERPMLEIRSMLDPLLIVGRKDDEPSKPASIGFVPPEEPGVIATKLAAADAVQEPAQAPPPDKPGVGVPAGIEALVPPPDAAEAAEVKADVAEVKDDAVPPKVTREEVLQDIERESVERRAEIRAIEAIKPKLAERDKQISRERRKVDVFESQKMANAQRPKFRAELRKILASRGTDLGTEVSELRERSLLPVQPDIENAVAKVLQGSSRKMKLTRSGRIEFMRLKGMSEPDILGILAYDEGKKIAQRATARDLREVWVRAAKQLLMVPIATERAAQGTLPASDLALPASSR